MAPPTDICLTIDVEFSIGGAFENPTRNRPVAEPAVECRVNGEDHGLGFILRTLAAHGQRATFFVEPLSAHYFGDEPMRRYAHRIAAAGHEVGLHVHPCWRVFAHQDWHERVKSAPPSDDVRGRPEAEVAEIILDALHIMGRWGLPRPTSVRMGNLMCDLTLYRVLARLGLRAASNVGLAIQPCEDAALRLTGGVHTIHGVTELPVLTYTAALPLGLRRQRCLTITGTGAATTRHLLRAARSADGGPVVILTHPFEFAKTRDAAYADLRPNRINQRRLQDLCAFIAAHPAEYRMTGVTEAAERAAEEYRARPFREVSAGAASVLPELAANRLNDLVWRL